MGQKELTLAQESEPIAAFHVMCTATSKARSTSLATRLSAEIPELQVVPLYPRKLVNPRHPPNVLVWELEEDRAEQTDELLEATKRLTSCTIIALSRQPDTIRPKLLDRPDRLLVFDERFGLSAVGKTIRNVAKKMADGFQGHLKLELVDLLQFLHLSTADRTVLVNSRHDSCRIHFKKGEIVSAATSTEIGASAVLAALKWPGGTFAAVELDHPVEEIVTISFKHLLLDTLRQLDELKKSSTPRSRSENSVATEDLPPRVFQTSAIVDRQQDGPELSPQRRKQMSLDLAIKEVIRNVPECLAAGYVDMTTGMLLGVKTVDSHPQEVLDLVAAATGDIFQGANVVAIENMFKKIRGVDDREHYFYEIIVNSKNLIHIFMRAKKSEDQVLVIVASASANLGMVISKSRQALTSVEAAA